MKGFLKPRAQPRHLIRKFLSLPENYSLIFLNGCQTKSLNLKAQVIKNTMNIKNSMTTPPPNDE